MDFRTIAAPAEIAVKILDVGRLEIAPTRRMGAAGGEIGGRVAALHAVLQVAGGGAERPAGRLDFAAVVGEAVLQLHVQRAAERVEAEHRVRAFQVDLVDRGLGQRVPVDRVAERLVEADAVDIDGEPLRRALQR